MKSLSAPWLLFLFLFGPAASGTPFEFAAVDRASIKRTAARDLESVTDALAKKLLVELRTTGKVETKTLMALREELKRGLDKEIDEQAKISRGSRQQYLASEASVDFMISRLQKAEEQNVSDNEKLKLLVKSGLLIEEVQEIQTTQEIENKWAHVDELRYGLVRDLRIPYDPTFVAEE